jgi:hypothetical protein
LEGILASIFKYLEIFRYFEVFVAFQEFAWIITAPPLSESKEVLAQGPEMTPLPLGRFQSQLDLLNPQPPFFHEPIKFSEMVFERPADDGDGGLDGDIGTMEGLHKGPKSGA